MRKLAEKSKGIAKVLMLLLRFEEISLHCGNMDISAYQFFWNYG